MGLDMYLYKRKPEIPIFNELSEQIGILFGEKEEVGYWRKAKIIFAWFENRFGGIENDGNYEVTKDMLVNLYKKCIDDIKETRADSSEYVELTHTVDILRPLIENSRYGDTFIFNADW